MTVARAALWGLALAVVLRAIGLPAPALTATVVGIVSAFLWHGRAVWSRRSVALWLDERHPELGYALVAAVDPGVPAAAHPALDAAAARVSALRALRRHAAHTVGPAALALGLALLATAAPSRRLVSRAVPRQRSGAAAAPVARLSPIGGTLMPPAYAGSQRRRLDDPSTIDGLPGSRVELRGPGSVRGLAASLGDRTLAVADDADGWRLAFVIPDSAVVLQLAAGGARRLVVIAPRRDAPPAVRLTLPARDTVVRSAGASITLDAELADDIGLASAHIELIVSAGESEGNFISRERVAGARSLGGARAGRLHLVVPLASLGLAAGGQLAVRAVAVDRNDVNGPGRGWSETRIVRVARPGEYDSLAATSLGVPPPAREGIATLSMLVLRTEQLHRESTTLAPVELRRRAEALARIGDDVERRLDEVIATQSGEEPGAHVHAEGERAGEDARLREASFALRDGLTELRVARTGSALPHLHRASRALDAYRVAARYYARGRVQDVVVNTARARLAGRDSGRAGAGEPRPPLAGAEVLRRAYADAVRELPAHRGRAAERLTVVLVDALRADTALAATLGDAVSALRAGRDASPALLRARHILFGAAVVRDSLPRWNGFP
jgi:hypothetical protein